MRSLRMDELTTRLTIVATIFLPLTFLTGFFGQNFGFARRHIASPGAFWGLRRRRHDRVDRDRVRLRAPQ